MQYEIFRLEDERKSIIKARFLVTRLSEKLQIENEDDCLIEVIEIDDRGFLNSSFYGENELLYCLAIGHQYWKGVQSLTKALDLCEKELDDEVILGTGYRSQ